MKKDTHTPVDENIDPDLPVPEGLPDIDPGELFSLCDLNPGDTANGIRLGTILGVSLPLILKTENDEVTLLLSQKSSCLGEIVQEPEGEKGDDDGGDALEDKDPPPTFETSNTVHLGDSKSKQATKGTCDGGSRKEQGLAELDLVPAVPHG